MIEGLHGKFYYTEVPDVFIGDIICLTAEKYVRNFSVFALNGIKFTAKSLRVNGEMRSVIVPTELDEEGYWCYIEVGAFRGELYSAYEAFKRYARKTIKTQGGVIEEVQ